MADFLDYDPVTGIRHDLEYDEMTGEARITYTQDVEHVLEYTKRLANDGLTDGGIKKGWWLYAKIPPIVQIQMRAKGIDIMDPNATNRIIQEINTHYPMLKTTQKNEGTKEKQIYVV